MKSIPAFDKIAGLDSKKMGSTLFLHHARPNIVPLYDYLLTSTRIYTINLVSRPVEKSIQRILLSWLVLMMRVALNAVEKTHPGWPV